MKVFCRISGLYFFSSDEFREESILLDYHPIFKLPARDLLAKARKWSLGKYTEQEEKLLFLALLNATEAVDWEIPCDPDIHVVKKNLESVYKLLAWYSVVTPGALKLPKMRVSAYNSSLSNISQFITVWYEVRKEWIAPSSQKFMADLLESREFVLHKLIHSSQKNPEQYLGRLASWMLDAAKVENSDAYPDKRQVWGDIFRTKLDVSALSLDKDELDDLVDYMDRELYAVDGPGHKAGVAGNASAQVLAHLHKLQKIKEGGMLGLLGGELGGPGNTFKIKSDESSEEEIELSARELEAQLAKVPSSEPKHKDYVGKLSDWIRDRAAWILSAPVRENLEYLRSKQSQGDSGKSDNSSGRPTSDTMKGL